MATLYLHIGTEKTGTTSIQSYLRKNPKFLDNARVNYPKSIYNNNDIAHFNLAASILKNNNKSYSFVPDYKLDTLEELNFLRSQVPEGFDCIISAEHFSSRFGLKEINEFRELLDDVFFGFDIKVLVCLRRQDELFESSYSTIIKSGGTLSIIEAYNKAMAMDYYFDYKKMIDNWVVVFGEECISISTFCEAKQSGIVSTFLNAVGLSVSVNENDYRFNESLSSSACVFGSRINTMKGAESRRILNFLSDLTKDDNFKLISQVQRSALVQKYYKDNVYIANKYLSRSGLFESDAYVWDQNYRYSNGMELYSSIVVNIVDDLMRS